MAEQFAVRIFSGMVSSASAAMPSWNSGKTKSPLLSAGRAEIGSAVDDELVLVVVSSMAAI